MFIDEELGFLNTKPYFLDGFRIENRWKSTEFKSDSIYNFLLLFGFTVWSVVENN